MPKVRHFAKRSFAIGDDLWDRLRAAADALDRSMASIIRVAVVEYLSQRQL